jgi:hypothetical protein
MKRSPKIEILSTVQPIPLTPAKLVNLKTLPPQAQDTMADAKDEMLHVELTQDEGLLLEEVLRSSLSDLRMEISHTDSGTFRMGLKRKALMLEEMLTTLEAREMQADQARAA